MTRNLRQIHTLIIIYVDIYLKVKYKAYYIIRSQCIYLYIYYMDMYAFVCVFYCVCMMPLEGYSEPIAHLRCLAVARSISS